MAIQRASRPLSAEEREQLASWSPPSFGMLSWAVNLFLVPCVLGGLAGWLLTLLRVRESPAYTTGLLAAFLFGSIRLWLELAENRRFWSPQVEARQKALSQGTVDLITITPVLAWEVTEVDDFGPAYLLDPDSDEVVFICSQELPPVHDGSLPIGKVSVEVIPHVRSVLSLDITPGHTPIATREVTLEEIGATVFDGVLVLPKSSLARGDRPALPRRDT